MGQIPSVQGAEKSSLPVETDFSLYVPMSGIIVSSGLTTACTYRFMSVGEKFYWIVCFGKYE